MSFLNLENPTNNAGQAIHNVSTQPWSDGAGRWCTWCPLRGLPRLFSNLLCSSSASYTSLMLTSIIGLYLSKSCTHRWEVFWTEYAVLGLSHINSFTKIMHMDAIRYLMEVGTDHLSLQCSYLFTPAIYRRIATVSNLKVPRERTELAVGPEHCSDLH